MNDDGSGIRRLTNNTLSKDRDSRWSPDGTEIVYEKFISNLVGLAHKNIYLMRANGEQQRPLFPDPKEGVATILCGSCRAGQRTAKAFYLMNASFVGINTSVTSPFSESAVGNSKSRKPLSDSVPSGLSETQGGWTMTVPVFSQ